MDNSINKSIQQTCSTEMKTELLAESFEETHNESSPFANFSENIWKNTYGIQALFIVHSTGKTLYSKYSKYFDNENYEQLDSIISSSCSSFTSSTQVNPMKISIGVYENFTSMTSQIGEQFLVMIVPNNTSVGTSIQFAESLSST